MNKIIWIVQNYLIIGLPFVIIVLTLSAINPNNDVINYAINHYKIFWNIFGIGLMLWFVILFLYLVSLIIAPTIREKTLKRLANLKERDEREEYITGKASRSAYISTLSIMIFFLFLSMFNLSIYKVPKDKSIDGHRYTLNMGFHYAVFNKVDNNTISEGTAVLDSKNIFPSTSTVILILLAWQLLAFNINARKENINNI